MKRKQYVILVEWVNIFEETCNTEIPCMNKKQMEKLVLQLKYQYRHDPFIQEYKVIPICR